VYEWNEAKRKANLKKHGLDFADADLVYENPGKLTIFTSRHGESRLQDAAIVEAFGLVLTLVYVIRGYNIRIRIISFRKASRKERRIYDHLRPTKQN
jgi:uncharacterized DUF497 family protein